MISLKGPRVISITLVADRVYLLYFENKLRQSKKSLLLTSALLILNKNQQTKCQVFDSTSKERHFHPVELLFKKTTKTETPFS